MSNQESKYDDVLFTVAKQTGGVSEFLGTVSSFLRRQTDFFSNNNFNDHWEHLLLNIFHKEHAKNIKLDISESEQFTHIQTDSSINETPIEDEMESGKLIPNAGNGCLLPNYSWTQTSKEIKLKIPLDVTRPLRARDLNVDITRKSLTVGIKGQKAIIDGELCAAVRPSESTWMLEDNKMITITLDKFKKNNWWDRLVLSDPPILLHKLVPKSLKLSDMDPEERKVVEKMHYNHRQRKLGLPTSDSEEKRNFFEQFKESHPELNFSQCKL